MIRTHQPAVRRFVLAGVLALSISQLGATSGGPFGSIHVAANRSAYNGRGCPVEIMFTATINFVVPHGDLVFNYHWERSDGAKTPVQVVPVSRNKRSISIHEKWLFGSRGHHYEASTALFVNSGNTHMSEASRVISVTCN